MLAPTTGRPVTPPQIVDLMGGDRGVWGVLGEAELEGWETTHIRPEGTPVFILYSLFFLIYYLRRAINDRPYILNS